jgi:DNA-binding transcriptional regulator YiaG
VQQQCDTASDLWGREPLDAVTTWTGARADALRRAFRMTNESFAEHLGVVARTVAYWRQRGDVVLRPATQGILDTALAQAPAQVREQFSQILSEANRTEQPDISPAESDNVAGLTTWITASSTSDAAIDRLEQAAVAVTEMHARAPARQVLDEVLALHHGAQLLLRRGRQRLRQARRLIRLDGDILAHASVLLGDVGQDQAADDYGHAALLYLQEAEASEATAWYALAKTARWRHSYATAAELASQGLVVLC